MGKPLKDLEELYSKHSRKEVEEENIEDAPVVPEVSIGPIAESRSGEAHPLVDDGDTKSLMTSDLAAPELPNAEDLPLALPLTDMRNRSRKRVKEEKNEENNEEKPDGPKAEPLRARPSEKLEEYYYYDDDYYYDDEYYYDNIPTPTERTKPKYANFPPASISKPKEYKPKPKPKPTSKYTKPKPSSYDSKPKPSSYDSKPKSSPYDSKPKPSHYDHKSKASYESRYKKPSSKNSYKSDYNIASTIKRLQDIKKSQLKRNGLPSLPNPWERFNMYAPPKSSKTDSRKSAESRRSKPKPKPKVTKPYTDHYDDYYYDDHYYDSHKRQGYGAPAASGGANPLALLIAATAVAINPVLVTVSVTGKRRRRRDLDTVIGNNQGITPELEEKIHEMQVLEKFMSSVPENTNYQQQVLSMYLSCSGYTEMTNHCLDRVVCEYANNNSVKQEERDVISIVLYNIMANEYVSDGYKDR